MIVRAAAMADLQNLLDIQEAGAVADLSHIFPQDRHPFPRSELQERWQHEIADPRIGVYVTVDAAGAITGFAAARGNEFLHLGTAQHTWGTGVAVVLHDAVLRRFAETGVQRARLYVFTDNHRARRFYVKMGWTPTGARKNTPFPPHPELLEYVRAIPGRPG